MRTSALLRHVQAEAHWRGSCTELISRRHSQLPADQGSLTAAVAEADPVAVVPQAVVPGRSEPEADPDCGHRLGHGCCLAAVGRQVGRGGCGRHGEMSCPPKQGSLLIVRRAASCLATHTAADQPMEREHGAEQHESRTLFRLNDDKHRQRLVGLRAVMASSAMPINLQ